MASDPAYRDIPGTTIFDSAQVRKGYHLNMACTTLMKEENRQAFCADERGYLERHALSPEQVQAVLDRDYNRMIALGGNIYYLSKIAYLDGESFQTLASRMSGVSLEAFRRMMLAGGRAPGWTPGGNQESKHG